jgi:hypothetical protein
MGVHDVGVCSVAVHSVGVYGVGVNAWRRRALNIICLAETFGAPCKKKHKIFTIYISLNNFLQIKT